MRIVPIGTRLGRERNDGRRTHGIFGANSSDERGPFSNGFSALEDQRSGHKDRQQSERMNGGETWSQFQIKIVLEQANRVFTGLTFRSPERFPS